MPWSRTRGSTYANQAFRFSSVSGQPKAAEVGNRQKSGKNSLSQRKTKLTKASESEVYRIGREERVEIRDNRKRREETNKGVTFKGEIVQFICRYSLPLI